MGFFGLGRDEVNRIAAGHARENRCYGHNCGIDEEKKRICQVVSVLLATIPKEVLNKKVKIENIPYGTDVFPYSWFEDEVGEKLTFRDILVRIDP